MRVDGRVAGGRAGVIHCPHVDDYRPGAISLPCRSLWGIGVAAICAALCLGYGALDVP